MKERALIRKFTPKPATDRDARIQGIAMVRALLNDSQDEITKSIARCPHTVDQRCQMVHTMLRDERAKPDVVFTIATWCMLGGNTASSWAEGGTGQKPGEKATLSEWGKKMVAELEHVGRTGHIYFDYDFCKPYVTVQIFQSTYNYDAALWYWGCLPKPEKDSAAKHAADISPENSDPAKRRKITANTDYPFAHLSRDKLEALCEALKSRNKALSEDSSANFSLAAMHRKKANELEDLVKKASTIDDGASILDLVQADLDLREDIEKWDDVLVMKQCEMRNLVEWIPRQQGISDRLDERVSSLRDEAATLEGRISTLGAQAHDQQTLIAENTKLRADLELSKLQTARLKRCLDDL